LLLLLPENSLITNWNARCLSAICIFSWRIICSCSPLIICRVTVTWYHICLFFVILSTFDFFSDWLKWLRHYFTNIFSFLSKGYFSFLLYFKPWIINARFVLISLLNFVDRFILKSWL
jgi:hypothetical protein